ncbi:hypothetical protein FE391_27770 [Nonomuraea sp. KC401]|uniref:hypothetical protein n=1 Tax=unclassified Nonomuraea TaxID=2593643 RepID=UPI0010FF5D8E|nr:MULTISPECIES: hypothetical protein [unclassified Nonomuraea]NBE94504.1 hypothetical protein [Nonomuraea sp. K271]TLF64041.1 hypothetical protein FE391_27770 [Nonomuraea sp. KC401]
MPRPPRYDVDDLLDAALALTVAQDRRLRSALRALAGRLEVDLERLAIAVVDLPYAVVRRHLANGGAIASSVADTVENCTDTPAPRLAVGAAEIAPDPDDLDGG